MSGLQKLCGALDHKTMQPWHKADFWLQPTHGPHVPKYAAASCPSTRLVLSRVPEPWSVFQLRDLGPFTGSLIRRDEISTLQILWGPSDCMPNSAGYHVYSHSDKGRSDVTAELHRDHYPRHLA